MFIGLMRYIALIGLLGPQRGTWTSEACRSIAFVVAVLGGFGPVFYLPLRSR